jgi:glycosyltransferase involved in cell wall biosynthesis
MPKVSVILPNYNHEKYLDKRIESILNQDFKDFELIILDDASQDKSTEVIQKYLQDPRITEFIINDKNSGSPFIQWQKGMYAAKGDYIWIAESDDITDYRFLSEMVKILEENKKIGVAFSPSIWIDEDAKELHTPSHEEDEDTWNGDELIKNDFLIGNLIYNASSAVFRKNLLNKVNFSMLADFKYTGDWLFWVQLITKSHVKRIGKRYNFFRRHSNNISFKSENEGLQFIEGVKIINYIFKNHTISFGKERKTMLYWAKKIALTKLNSPIHVLKKMPLEIRFWHLIFKNFS